MEKIVLEFNTNVKEVSQDIDSFKKQLEGVSKSSFSKGISNEIQKIEQSIKDLKTSDLGFEEKTKELAKLQGRLNGLNNNFNTLQSTQSKFNDTIKNTNIGVGGFQVSVGSLQQGFTALRGGVMSSLGSLQAFKVGLMSTGIGAIVVLIGTLIASFTTFTQSTQEGSDKMAQLGAKLTAAFKPFYDLLVGTGRVLFSIVEGAADLINYATGTEKIAKEMADTVKQAQQLEKINAKLNTQADKELATQETLKNIRDDENQTLEARLEANNKLLVSINKEFETRKQMLKNSIEQLEREINQNRNAVGVREKEIELEKLKGELSKNEADRQGKINEQITNRVSLQRELNQLALENQGIMLEIAKVNGAIRTGDRNDQAIRTQMAQQEYAMKKAEIEDAIRARVMNQERINQIAIREYNIKVNEENIKRKRESLIAGLSKIAGMDAIKGADVILSGGTMGVTNEKQIQDEVNKYRNKILEYQREISEINSASVLLGSNIDKAVKDEMNRSLQLQQAGLKLQLEISKINKDRLDAIQKAELDTLESNLKIKEAELEQISNTDTAYLKKQLEILDLKKEIDTKGKFYELQLKGTFDKNLIEFINIDPRQSQLSLDEYDKFFKALQKTYSNEKQKINEEFSLNVTKKLITDQIDRNNQIIATNEDFSQERIKAERDNLSLEYALKMAELDKKDSQYKQKLKTLQDQEKKALEDFDKSKQKSVLEYDIMLNNMRINNFQDFQKRWLKLQIETFEKEAQIKKLNAKSQEEIDLIELEKSKKIKNAQLQQEESYNNNVLDAYLFTAEQIARIDAGTVEGKKQLKQVEAQIEIDGLSAASQVAGAFASMSNKQSEERKALLVTQASLEAVAGAASAYTSSLKIDPTGITGGILAALALGVGAANVARIAETPAGSIEGGEDYAGGLTSLKGAVGAGANIDRRAMKARKVKVGRLATGGMVEGSGTGTSDSVPAFLSNGESVINARSTAMFAPLLSRINEIGGGKSFATTVSADFIKDANKNKTQNDALLNSISQMKLGVSVKEINNVNSRIQAKQSNSIL